MTSDSPGTPADELFRAVADRLDGTAYVVERTSDGFVVRVDLADERWYAQQHGRERRKVVQNHVLLHEDARTLEITDEHVEVSWRSGAWVPALDVSTVRVERQRGRVHEVSFRKTVGRSASGAWETKKSHRFDTAEAHDHIRAAAARLDWQERSGRAERTGRVAAIAGGVVAALTIGLLGVAAALRLL